MCVCDRNVIMRQLLISNNLCIFQGTRHINIQCEITVEMAKIFQLRLALRNFSLPKIKISEGSVQNGIKVIKFVIH